MNMVDASTLLTIIYVLVDDWYQQHGQYHNIYSRLIIPTEMDDLSYKQCSQLRAKYPLQTAVFAEPWETTVRSPG